MNLAVLSRTSSLVPMERLVLPDFTEIGGYPKEVRVPLHPPDVHLTTDDAPAAETPTVDLQKFRFVIPRPTMEGGRLSSVVITLYAATKEEALIAVVDGRLREAAPWVPRKLMSGEPAPATPILPAG